MKTRKVFSMAMRPSPSGAGGGGGGDGKSRRKNGQALPVPEGRAQPELGLPRHCDCDTVTSFVCKYSFVFYTPYVIQLQFTNLTFTVKNPF